MNKKGFIATSLILTFFLLFCTILLALMANYNFNTNLINHIDVYDPFIQADYAQVECVDENGNILENIGKMEWNNSNNNWEFSLTNVSNGKIKCNYIFKDS